MPTIRISGKWAAVSGVCSLLLLSGTAVWRLGADRTTIGAELESVRAGQADNRDRLDQTEAQVAKLLERISAIDARVERIDSNVTWLREDRERKR